MTKMTTKKPAGSVSEMKAVPGTTRTKRAFDHFGKVIGEVQTRTLAYPADHPRSLYKAAKKAAKAVK